MTAAVQHLRLGQTAAEPKAGPAATTAAAPPPANTAAPKPGVEPAQQDAGTGAGLGYTTVVGPDGELWVPDS